MSEYPYYYASIDIYTPGGLITCPRVLNCEINQPITEGVFDCHLSFDYTDLTSKENPGIQRVMGIGQTINVYIARGSEAKTLEFSGIIEKINKEVEGHNPREVRILSRGYGDYLIGEYYGFTRLEGKPDEVVNQLLSPLVARGKIKSIQWDTSSHTVRFEHLGDQVSLWDGISDIARQANYDFYVDNGGTIWGFESGSKSGTIDLTNKIYKFSYELNGESIINSQRVIGAGSKTIGTDLEYTESNSGWNSNGDNGAEQYNHLILDESKMIDPDPNYGKGDYVIRAIKSDGSGGIYLERTFSPSLDLSFFGFLNFAFKYIMRTSRFRTDVPQSVVLSIVFESDNGGMFATNIEMSGVSWIVSEYLMKGYVYGWNKVQLPFNIRAKDDITFKVYGSPSWSSIKKIRFSVVSPLPESSYSYPEMFDGEFWDALLMIDDLYFDGGFYHAFSYSSSSINKYGERRGRFLYIPELVSDNECNYLADRIVTQYSEPIPMLESIETPYNLTDFKLGYKYNISLLELGTIQGILRKKTISIDNAEMRVIYTIASIPIPSIDTMISEIKKKIDEDKFQDIPDINLATALVPYQLGPLGQQDVNISQSWDNLINNPSFELDSDGDSIPDKWFPSDPSFKFMSSDEKRFGEFSAWLRYDYTLSSDLVPIDPNGGYYTEIWGLGKHGTSRGTFSAHLIFYGGSPNYLPLSTITICNNESPNDWTRYYKVIDYVNIPVTSKYAKLHLKNIGGTASFIDDVLFQRLVGVDAGRINYTRPKTYSTTQIDPVLVYSETFECNDVVTKYVVTKAGLELKSESGDHTASGRIVCKWNNIPRDTFHWSTRETTFQRFTLGGSINPSGAYGESLTVEYYLWTESGGMATMQNPEVWLTPLCINKRLSDPFDKQKPE